MIMFGNKVREAIPATTTGSSSSFFSRRRGKRSAMAMTLVFVLTTAAPAHAWFGTFQMVMLGLTQMGGAASKDHYSGNGKDAYWHSTMAITGMGMALGLTSLLMSMANDDQYDLLTEMYELSAQLSDIIDELDTAQQTADAIILQTLKMDEGVRDLLLRVNAVAPINTCFKQYQNLLTSMDEESTGLNPVYLSSDAST